MAACDRIPDGEAALIVGDGIFTADEKRRALEAVVRSGGFARSDQLKRFLRYICEMEMAGRAGEISEYTIGTEALGRPAGYTPGDDSSVRSRAYALRQKLAEYYETENPGAEIRIELRKGPIRLTSWRGRRRRGRPSRWHGRDRGGLGWV